MTPREHLQALVGALPEDAPVTVPAAWIRSLLTYTPAFAIEAPAAPAVTWREKIWQVPAETRLGAPEAAEAIGRPLSWVYRRTSAKSTKASLPHRKLDGALTFTAGDLRTWLTHHEAVIERAA